MEEGRTVALCINSGWEGKKGEGSSEETEDQYCAKKHKKLDASKMERHQFAHCPSLIKTVHCKMLTEPCICLDA